MSSVVIAPDKFKGTASASEVSNWIEQAAIVAGYSPESIPMSDGGEGLLEALGGMRRVVWVTSPLGKLVRAEWRISGKTAVIEMAQASGITIVGGPERNDPLAASTRGTGELIVAALLAGATEIIVGCGGSATTDGGVAALAAMEPLERFADIQLRALVDVDAKFLDSADLFGAQKGASPAQVVVLSKRLREVATEFKNRFDIDVTAVEGGGAAGGLGGALFALGAEIESGFEYVARYHGLRESIQRSRNVVTGEGRLDETSFMGKAVGSIIKMAQELGANCLVVAGSATDLGRQMAQSLGAEVQVLPSTLESGSLPPPTMRSLVIRCVRDWLVTVE